MVADRCDLPDGYDTGSYESFSGTPTKVLEDGENIELGGQIYNCTYTGPCSGAYVFLGIRQSYLFTGTWISRTLFAYYRQQTRTHTLLLEKISSFRSKVFPAHHSLDIQPEILIRMRNVVQAVTGRW